MRSLFHRFIREVLSVFKKQGRGSLVLKNIFALVLIKGGVILIGLILVPLTISYLTAEKYGIWLTIVSIVGWLNFFDVGFGHGIRNRIAEAKANEDLVTCRKFISTGYAVLGCIAMAIVVVGCTSAYFVDWCSFLKVSSLSNFELVRVCQIFICGVGLHFVLNTLNIVAMANQEPALSSFLIFLGQLFQLSGVWLLVHFTDTSLVFLASVVVFVPHIVTLLASVFLFLGRYRNFRPSIKFVDFGLISKIASLGISFFVIQIGVIVLYHTANIIITREFGGVAVAKYNVAYKYLSVAYMAFSIIMTPIWSAMTEAYVVRDFPWMRSVYKRLQIIAVFSFLALVVLFALSSWVFPFWLQGKIEVSWSMLLSVSIFFVVHIWSTLHAVIINGIGCIRAQLICVLIAAIIFPFVALYNGLGLGPEGVVLSMAFCAFIPALIMQIQLRKILNGSATGIWLE